MTGVSFSLREARRCVAGLRRGDLGNAATPVTTAPRAAFVTRCTPLRRVVARASGHRIEDRRDVLLRRVRVDDGEARQGLAAEGRRHDERELLAEQPVGPGLVVLRTPAETAGDD